MVYFYNCMEKPLYRRLLKTALISSPIIGLYGVTPVYIFNKVPPLFILLAGSGIMINVFIYWLINIGIIRYSDAGKKWRWYLLSYTIIIIIHIVFVLLRNVLPTPAFLNETDFPFKRDVFIAYPFISVLAINTIILIICNSVLTAQKNKNAELEIEQLKVNNLQAQKQVLLQQLQPHFLFNTLSVLKSLIKENPDEAENYSLKLSEFLRYSIQEHKKDLVTVEQELKFTTDYIDLQKVRFEESLIFYVNIPDIILSAHLPAFALQTLVENAIKHNSFTEKRPLFIKLLYADSAITVRNNKMLGKVTDTTGTGLENLNQRYKIITNREIVVKDEKDEFSVSVPLVNDKII
jgi:two-component system, LytTR family, sensor kinase